MSRASVQLSQFQFMAQGLVGIPQLGGRRQEMVGGVEVESLGGGPFRPGVEVLEAGREAVEIGGDIEEIHRPVEVVAGAVQGVEAPDGVMVRDADHPPARRREVLVAAEVVVAGRERERLRKGHRGLDAAHPGQDRDAVFILSPLPVGGGLGGPGFRLEGEVGAEELLVAVYLTFPFFTVLHGDVRQEEGGAEGCPGQVQVVPEGLHGLVGLDAARIEGAARHVFRVLVVGQDEVGLLGRPVQADPERIVGDGGHSPVVVAENALVVIDEVLPAGLEEKALFPFPAGPGLADLEAAEARAAPDAALLEADFGRQPRSLVGEAEPRAAQDEGGGGDFRVLFPGGESAVTDFAPGQVVDLCGKAIVLLGPGFRGGQEGEGGKAGGQYLLHLGTNVRNLMENLLPKSGEMPKFVGNNVKYRHETTVPPFPAAVASFPCRSGGARPEPADIQV